jgi:predicted Fe-Mo cluster-binding NifX family protein
MRIGIGIDTETNLTNHFGKCDTFAIFDFVDTIFISSPARFVMPFCPANGDKSDQAIAEVTETLADCDLIVAAAIGPCALKALEAKGIESREFDGSMNHALDSLRADCSRPSGR